MAKVKIEVLDAVVSGQPKGSQFELDEKDADHLASIGYVKKLGKVEEPKKATAKPKEPAKASKAPAKKAAPKASTKDK